MILVSTICISKNCIDLVEKTIYSIAKQNYKNREIIFIDNLSTDGTVKKIKETCLRNNIDHYKIISEKDEGIADAMNKGWKLSQGKIINFLHFGDVYSDQNIMQLAVIEFDNKAFNIFAGGAIFNYGTSKAFKAKPKKIEKIFFSNTFAHMAVFIDRDIIRILGGYNKQFKIIMDYDMWFRAYQLKLKFCYSDKVFVNLAPAGLSGNITKVISEFVKCKFNHIKIIKSKLDKIKVIFSLFVVIMKVLLYVFKN